MGCLLSGCASVSPSQYNSPRVIGRVIDGETRQPLKNVQIRRLTADANPKPLDAPHGADSLKESYVVRTDAKGAFNVKSERSLSLFGSGGWYSVTLAFERSGYAPLLKTYSLVNSTNAPSGEPRVQAGDIELAPNITVPRPK